MVLKIVHVEAELVALVVDDADQGPGREDEAVASAEKMVGVQKELIELNDGAMCDVLTAEQAAFDQAFRVDNLDCEMGLNLRP
jgi:hypothetical protein